MLTLLRPGYAKIMRLFYRDKRVKLHLREIARQTQLFEPSASRFLNSLEQDCLLHSEKDGNLKKYSVKKGIRAYFVFEAFDLERFENLPNIRRNAIKTFVNNLPEQPVFVVLFGSTAKETFTKESDIDVLLVTNKRINTSYAQEEVNALTAMKLSSFQIRYKDFVRELKLKDDKVVQSALNTGYPLINHIYYYETINDEHIRPSQIAKQPRTHRKSNT
jgi:predicted nucleotidyltransferase